MDKYSTCYAKKGDYDLFSLFMLSSVFTKANTVRIEKRMK